MFGVSFWFYLYIRTFTNVLLCFFLVVKGQLRWVGVWGGFLVFFLYIRTVTNVLLHFFLICDSQEFGIEMGRCLEAGFWSYLYFCFFLVVKGQLRWVGV